MKKSGSFGLSPEDVQTAIMDRLGRNMDRLGDREANIGASRIGYCARATVLDALNPTPVEPGTAGKFLVGRALENEVIQVMRLALGNRIRETGTKQTELKHPEAPLICHPDGRVIGPFEHEGVVYEGDGALEVKTASAYAFRKYSEKGLPLWYVDQNLTQQGLQGLGWGLFVVANAEKLSEIVWWVIPFNPDRFAALPPRAIWLKEQEAKGCVPAGEPDRGWCSYCKHKKACAEFKNYRQASKDAADAAIPASVRIELEMLGEEYAEFEADLKVLGRRERAIKEAARKLIEDAGLTLADLETVKAELRGGGESQEFDAKAFEAAEPELFKKYLAKKITKPSFYFTPKSKAV